MSKRELEAAESSFYRTAKKRRLPLSQVPSQRHHDMASELNDLGLDVTPDEVAFRLAWETAGWSASKKKSETLAANIQHVENRLTCIHGDADVGYTVFKQRKDESAV